MKPRRGWPLWAWALVLWAFQPGVTIADAFADGVDAYVRGDYASAYRAWKPLADDGDPVGMFNVGVLYARGLGVPEDLAVAAEWYRRAAEEGYAPAQFNLGVAYLQGLGREQNAELAAKWFQSAAEQNHAQSQYNLGSLYWQGIGVTRDEQTAQRWFERAAEAGDPRAADLLARIRGGDQPVAATASKKDNGGAKPPSPPPGATPVAKPAPVQGWIASQPEDGYTVQLFADRSQSGAERFMAQHPLRDQVRFVSRTGWHKVIAGTFVTRAEASRAVSAYPESLKQLKPWIRTFAEVQRELASEPVRPASDAPRAEPGAVESQTANAVPPAGGTKSSPPPESQRTAVHGSSDLSVEEQLASAQQALNDQDFIAARHYWEPLAVSGNAEAQYGLGYLYEAGLGLNRSDKEAFEWYRRAAEQGHSRAQFGLGVLYLEGRGVIPNEGLGLYWIQSAADKQDARAREYLADFRSRLSGAHDE